MIITKQTDLQIKHKLASSSRKRVGEGQGKGRGLRGTK